MRRWEAPRITLIGPAMAPPVELHRWLLERRNIAHEYVRRAAGLHAFASRRHRVPIELPLILAPAGAVGGLRPSLEWLDASLSARERLFPGEDGRALADMLCVRLFGPSVKTFYHHMLRAPRALVPAAIAGTPLTDRLFVRLLRPIWIRMMRLGLGLDGFDAAAAEAEIDSVFTAVEARLTADRPYLAGTEPGDEDILFAVLASPVILPANHPATLPADETLPAPFRALVERFRARPAGDLARRVYEQRPPPRDYG
ncbi:MAG: hypothetical protein M3177_07070, partial [Pseudomonadota bacterium]|nr:hypothetical protein [Pseudomonadota bacterium]